MNVSLTPPRKALLAAVLRTPSDSNDRDVMYRPRKSFLPAILVAALFGGTPALASAQASGSVGHTLPVQVATLPARRRRRQRVRRAKVLEIVLWAARRMRGARESVRARHQRAQPRLPPHDSFARGPPRATNS